MSRWHADIWSHPSHYLVDRYTWPWSPNGQEHIWHWKFKYQCHCQGQTHYHIWGLEFKLICLLFVSWQSDHFWLRCSKFHIWPWKFKVKITAKVKFDDHIWGIEFNWCVCFSFHGNRTIFGRDIANSSFDLENSRSLSWPRSNPMVTFEVLRSIDMFAFRFVVIDHLWLRYSQFDIWPWKFKVKVTTKIDQNLISKSIGQSQQSCQKLKKSKKLFKSYPLDKNLRAAAAAAAAAYEPVQKHKVTPSIRGWLNDIVKIFLSHDQHIHKIPSHF